MTDLLHLENDLVALRPFEDGDAAFIVSLLNSEGWLRFIGDRGIREENAALDYIRNVLQKAYEQNGFGLLCVIRKTDGEKIGMCGLIKRATLEDIDIGFAFLPEYAGKGYGASSAKLVLDAARNISGVHRIVAITNTDNAASIRLLEKIGLAFEKNILLPGEEKELAFFAVEWD